MKLQEVISGEGFVSFFLLTSILYMEEAAIIINRLDLLAKVLLAPLIKHKEN